jgi:Tfp pilus assembly protein PilO
MRRRWRDRLRIPLVALIVLNAGVYFSYTMPRTMSDRDAAARAAALQAQVEHERALTAALRGRADAMRSNRDDAERFYAHLGPKGTLIQVRAEITALARELGLRVGSLAYSPADVKGGEGVSTLQMRMPVTGTYRELAAFLDRLERSAYFVTVDQISLRKRQAPGEAADLDIALSAFYRSPSGAPEAAR